MQDIVVHPAGEAKNGALVPVSGPVAARRELQRAVEHHHFHATRELAARYEYGKKGIAQDLPEAIAMYEAALEAGHDCKLTMRMLYVGVDHQDAAWSNGTSGSDGGNRTA